MCKAREPKLGTVHYFSAGMVHFKICTWKQPRKLLYISKLRAKIADIYGTNTAVLFHSIIGRTRKEEVAREVQSTGFTKYIQLKLPRRVTR